MYNIIYQKAWLVIIVALIGFAFTPTAVGETITLPVPDAGSVQSALRQEALLQYTALSLHGLRVMICCSLMTYAISYLIIVILLFFSILVWDLSQEKNCNFFDKYFSNLFFIRLNFLLFYTLFLLSAANLHAHTFISIFIAYLLILAYALYIKQRANLVLGPGVRWFLLFMLTILVAKAFYFDSVSLYIKFLHLEGLKSALVENIIR